MKVFKLCLFVFIAVFISVCFYMFFNVKKALKYYPLIENYSTRYNVDPFLIVSIIKVESNFNPNAKSKKGAIGLMQIMPSTAKEVSEIYLNYGKFDEDKLYEPEFNIMVGVYYVKILSEMFDDNLNLVLASYNAGLGNVQKWHKENPIIEYDPQQMPFNETKNYVSKIDKIYNIIKSFK